MLTAKYLGFVVLGFLTFAGGIPTLSIVTFDSFTTWMSGALVLASITGVVASFRRDWEWVEKWAALVISALLSSWAVAAILRVFVEYGLDLDRAGGAFAVLLLAMLPAARSFALMTKAGV